MTIGLHEAKLLIECEKQLVALAEWKPVENREGRAEKHIFEARIAIDGTLPRGLWFRILVYPRFLNCGTFQLDCDKPGSRSHHTLYRLEWRPIRGHINGQHGPPEYRGLPFRPGETHHHCCLDHTVDAEGRIRAGDVQCARPIVPDFRNFDEALAFACDTLRIWNRADIPRPGDQGALF